MKNEIITTTFLVGVILGAILEIDAISRQNTIEAIIGAALIMTGLLSMELERIIDSIQTTGAALIACQALPEFNKKISKIVKRKSERGSDRGERIDHDK